MSEHGMRLETKEPVPLRAHVQVQIDNPELKASATVRSCRRVRLNYHIGLEFVGKAWKAPETKQSGSF